MEQQGSERKRSKKVGRGVPANIAYLLQQNSAKGKDFFFHFSRLSAGSCKMCRLRTDSLWVFFQIHLAFKRSDHPISSNLLLEKWLQERRHRPHHHVTLAPPSIRGTTSSVSGPPHSDHSVPPFIGPPSSLLGPPPACPVIKSDANRTVALIRQGEITVRRKHVVTRDSCFFPWLCSICQNGTWNALSSRNADILRSLNLKKNKVNLRFVAETAGRWKEEGMGGCAVWREGGDRRNRGIASQVNDWLTIRYRFRVVLEYIPICEPLILLYLQ